MREVLLRAFPRHLADETNNSRHSCCFARRDFIERFLGRKTILHAEAANSAIGGGDRRRNPICYVMVQTELKGDPAGNGKRHVVSWDLNFLKSIVTLQFRKAVTLLLPVSHVGTKGTQSRARRTIALLAPLGHWSGLCPDAESSKKVH